MTLNDRSELAAPARFHNVPGLLLAFVVVSVLIHGSTLLFSTENTVLLPEQRLGSNIISVVLAPAINIPAEVPPQSAPPKTSPKKSDQPLPVIHAKALPALKTAKPIPATKAETGSHIKQTQIKQQTKQAEAITEDTIFAETGEAPAEVNKKSATKQQRQQQRNYLLGELQNRLSRYLSYPLRARRRGWQGEVMISLHINKFGQLNDVRLAKSSGYSLLDSSAVSAVTRLKDIALPNAMGRLQAMELQLPVRYELRES